MMEEKSEHSNEPTEKKEWIPSENSTWIPGKIFRARQLRLENLSRYLTDSDLQDMAEHFRVPVPYLKNLFTGEMLNQSELEFKVMERAVSWIHDLDIKKANQRAKILERHGL